MLKTMREYFKIWPIDSGLSMSMKDNVLQELAFMTPEKNGNTRLGIIINPVDSD